MTTQTMQIGNRPCRIYGEAHAEYLLLQMTGEHELQTNCFPEKEIAHLSEEGQYFCANEGIPQYEELLATAMNAF